MDKRTAERIAALSSEQRQLLELRLERQGLAVERADGDASPGRARPTSMSLLFFSSAAPDDAADKYQLLLQCARFADEHGLEAVWIPERHFKPFGGLFPNPAVLAAALAMITRRTRLRAGSVVLPLHDVLRVAEEWSVVDNLSGGRVDLAFASGWHPDDFALAPDRYAERRQAMLDALQSLQKLWRGEAVTRRNGEGAEVALRVFPAPIQRHLPLWITARSAATFVAAGRAGAHVLTGLIDQDVATCAARIRAYRQARAESGLDPAAGRVAVMLHTYVGESMAEVMALARAPMRDYLQSFVAMSRERVALVAPLAGRLTAADERALLDHAVDQYIDGRSLLGTAATCARTIERLAAIGVDEVACIVDFGLDADTIVRGLDRLSSLNQAATADAVAHTIHDPSRGGGA